jgi:hypothetical protein
LSFLGVGLDRSYIAKWIKILVLPLIDSHVELFPLGFKSLISKLLSHFFNCEFLKSLLVFRQLPIHANKLL